MSTITIAGNLTRDPELHNLGGGKTLTRFSIAENRRFTDKTGNDQETVTYLDVAAWGPMAANVANSLRTGDRVLVTGRLEQSTWEAPDGTRRTKHELVATEVAASLRYAEASLARRPKATDEADDDLN